MGFLGAEVPLLAAQKHAPVHKHTHTQMHIGTPTISMKTITPTVTPIISKSLKVAEIIIMTQYTIYVFKGMPL